MDHWQSPLTSVTLHLEGNDLVVTRQDGRIFPDSEQNEEALNHFNQRAEEAERAEKKATQRAEKESQRAEKEAQRGNEADTARKMHIARKMLI